VAGVNFRDKTEHRTGIRRLKPIMLAGLSITDMSPDCAKVPGVGAFRPLFQIIRVLPGYSDRREPKPLATNGLNCMDKTIRKYSNFDEMKADEYRYWQSRPVHERVAAVSELTVEGYTLKGFKPDAFRLQRTVVHFERTPR
jgi:hypothetical protein